MNRLKPSRPPRFQFKYRRQRGSLAGAGSGDFPAYPMLPCTFEWRARTTPRVEGRLDSGSDGLVMPMGIAEFLNLDLNDEERPMQVVSREVPQFSAKVNLMVGRGGHLMTFRNVTAHIPKEGNVPLLIGRDPVFKAYRVTFDDSISIFYLVPSG